MARFRPTPELVGLSPDARTVRTMALSWGVRPLQVGMYSSTDEMVWFAVEQAVGRGLVARGQVVLVLAGAPDRLGDAATDVLRLVEVG
jgi:pyruvate kinase